MRRCHNSNIVITAPANSATCSLTTNKPVLSSRAGNVIIAPVYPRDLADPTVIFTRRHGVGVYIKRIVSGRIFLDYSNTTRCPLDTNSATRVHLSSRVMRLIAFDETSRFRTVSRGLHDQEWWRRRTEGVNQGGPTRTGNGARHRRAVLHLVRRRPVDQRRMLLRRLHRRNFRIARTAVSQSVQRLYLIGTTATSNCHCISDRGRDLGPGVRNQFRAVFHRSILKISFTKRIILIGYCSNVTGTTYRIFSTLG